jgi:hypothetical protein
MLDLTLREEFGGKRLKGTTVDFTNQSKTGALEVPLYRFGQKIHQKNLALCEPQTVSFCQSVRVDLDSLMVKSAVLNDCLVHDGATSR